jgi:hypothetical protein
MEERRQLRAFGTHNEEAGSKRQQRHTDGDEQQHASSHVTDLPST